MKNRYGLEIRAATVADAPGLGELLAASGHVASARALTDRLAAIQSAPGSALIAAGWGPPVGLVVLHWYHALDADLPTAQVTMLLVALDDRRQGIGRMLLKAASQAARLAGCGMLELVAPPQDQAAQAFCEATGFVGSGVRFVRPLRKKPA